MPTKNTVAIVKEALDALSKSIRQLLAAIAQARKNPPYKLVVVFTRPLSGKFSSVWEADPFRGEIEDALRVAINEYRRLGLSLEGVKIKVYAQFGAEVQIPIPRSAWEQYAPKDTPENKKRH